MKDLEKKTASGLFYRLLERVGARLVTFVVSIVLARILMPEAYGTVALITVFITIANVFITYGFGNSLVVYKDSDQLDFSSCFYASLLLSLAAYAVLFFAAPFVADYYQNTMLTPILRVMGLQLPLAAVGSVQQAYVSKHMQFKLFFWSTLSATVLSGLVGIGMALLQCGPWALVGQYLTNVTVGTVVLACTVKWRPTLQFSFHRLKRLFSFGWKVLLIGLVDVFYDNLRSLIIAKRYSESDLAYYQKGQSFPGMCMDVLEPTLNSVLLPAFADVNDNMGRLKSIVKRVICLGGYIISPVFIGLAVVSEPLIRILLTDKWIACVPYMQILCLAYLFRTIQIVNVTVIKALGKGGLLLGLDILKKGIGVLLIVVGMFFGVEGIAWSFVGVSFISCIINALPNKKQIHYGWFEQMWDTLKPISLSLVMALVIYGLKFCITNPFLLIVSQVVLGVGFYAGVSALLKIDSFLFLKNKLFALLKIKKR